MAAHQALAAQGLSPGDSRMVVAIDYGTTFTGLGWAFVRSGQATVEDIQLCMSWPRRNSTKVPSAYSYSPSPSGSAQWGHDIEPGSGVMRWTKLELHRGQLSDEIRRLHAIVKGLPAMHAFRDDADNRALQNDIPRHLGLDAEDIVADYLTRVVREWYGNQQSQTRVLFETVPLDLVITHPSEWSYEARNKTVRAVLRAFSLDMFPQRRFISLVPEPEACALYTARSAIVNQRGRLQTGDCFVVCDAGGGTVDLVPYRLESIEPFSIMRVSSPVCVRGGASQIDRDFFKFLARVLAPFGTNLDDVGPGGHYVLNELAEELLEKFIPIKHAFEDGPDDTGFTLPADCTVLDGAYAQARVTNMALRLSAADTKQIFDPTVDRVIQFIAKQVTNLRAGTERYNVTHLFMSGGFSSSPYLLSRVEEWARRGRIQVERGDDCWGAVIRGAVMKGAGIGADIPAISTVCPRSYGVVADRPYMDYLDVNQEDVEAGRKKEGAMVRSQIIWLASMGDLIPADEPVVRSHEVHYRLSSKRSGFFHIPFIASRTRLEDRAKRQVDSEAARNEERILQVKHADIPAGDRKSTKAKLTIQITIKDNVNVSVISRPSGTVVATCAAAL